MKKHLLLFFLVFLPMAASADDSGSCGENVTYTFVEETGTLTISGTGAMTDYTSSSSMPWNSYKSKIETVVVTDGVTSIGNYAFIYCFDLTSVTIPNGVTSIGKQAFCACSHLTSITIPNSVTSIGGGAFEDCDSLTTVTIPNSVMSIGELAFTGCIGLTSITIENGNTIYDSRGNCNAIIKTSTNELIAGCKNTVIPNSVTSIARYAFWGCRNLTSITIPNSVTSIGNTAFKGCTGLTSINIPGSVTSISDHVFDGCSGLTSVTIGNNVTSIGIQAFRGCSGLTSITIPGSVTSISSYAFNSCSGLTSITVESGNTVYDSRGNCNAIIKTSTNELVAGCKNTVIPNSVTSIGSYAFDGCRSLTSITIPGSVTSIGQSAFDGCSGLTSITVESGNTVYDSRGNCNAIIKTSTNELIAGCKNTVIPNTVTSIGDYAFYGCSGLTSVTIPNSVTSIGSNSFEGCSGLTSVTIPNSVTSIGRWAFANCSGLNSVTIPNSVESIGEWAFYGCSGLTSVTCLAENVPVTESYTLDNTIIENAKLFVPAGSLSAYQAAAPWSGFGQITDQTDISQIDNVIYIEPFEARPGRTEREVSIKMKNSAAIRGFQFDLVLPEGVTPVSSGTSIYRRLNADRCPIDPGSEEKYHTLDVSLQPDGSYRFLCGSTQDQTFIGNDGEIILLKVNVDENQAERDYPIILKNIKLTESDIYSYYETDVLLTKIMVQNYEIGDISGDGAVDVSDYIGVANHILGNSPAGFNEQAADVNEDNVVDVSDYIGIANIILTGSIYGNINNAAPAFEEDAELDPQ